MSKYLDGDVAGPYEKLIPDFYFALREDIKDLKQFLPVQAEPLSSGYDVRAAFADRKSLSIRPGQYFKIPLGFRSFCPDGWYYTLHPRSSSFTRKAMHNLIGIIDESWEGETCFAGQYIPDAISLGKELIVEFGDRVGQIVPLKRNRVRMLEINNEEYNQWCKKRDATRGDGGFGSTGK